MALDLDIALCTVEEVAVQLGLSLPLSVSVQAIIEDLINAQSSMAADYLGRDLGYKANIVEYVRGYPHKRIGLARYPIVLITSIDDVPFADTGAFIESDGKTGLVDASCCAGFCYTGCYYGLNGYPLQDTASQKIKVIYSGGYCLPNQLVCHIDATPLPYSIRLAVASSAALMYRSLGHDPAVKREELQSYAVEYFNGDTHKGGISPSAMEILAKYVCIPQY